MEENGKREKHPSWGEGCLLVLGGIDVPDPVALVELILWLNLFDIVSPKIMIL